MQAIHDIDEGLFFYRGLRVMELQVPDSNGTCAKNTSNVSDDSFNSEAENGVSIVGQLGDAG